MTEQNQKEVEEASGSGPRWERGQNTRVPQFVEQWSRTRFVLGALVTLGAIAALGHWVDRLWLLLLVPVVPLVLLGVRDMLQTRHTILRNFPLLGHLRYLMESLRPELRQYFVESESEENPISREKRTVVYQRAKKMLDTFPFGTHRAIYSDGYEWVGHSLAPQEPTEDSKYVVVGHQCEAPYKASILNVSAMSFGALSANAILALNEGARRGGFYHNTGEGGISPYHLKPGGDLVWQIGTGYFGCRTKDGNFDPDKFAEQAAHASVKMIELKLSQGAKPSHGGILPGDKVTPEIAAIRGLPPGETVVSPPGHRAFKGPVGLLEFVAKLRKLSGGKPVGMKLCVGHPAEFFAIAKAMVERELYPDFITVDGAEGGTGAAPLEFSNSVGMPLEDGLTLVDNVLRGAHVRDKLRVISAGRITTGYHVLRQIALGADLCNSARAMMYAIGCIQALKCNTNKCPTGVTTQDPRYTKGLVVADKALRVANFHRATVKSACEIAGAAGLKRPGDLQPYHMFRRISGCEVRDFTEIYPRLKDGSLRDGSAPENYQHVWNVVSSERFDPGIYHTHEVPLQAFLP